ncbi:MAG TPA: LysE family translocator [Microvirga sp.]|nr:LysE family translocator [Microvirga sp.]
MTSALLLSMAAFSLAASISPGPVNVVALSSGMRYSFRPTIGYVTGATAGFTLLLILIGFGLNELIARLPQLLMFVRWAGVLFLVYMAVGLAIDDGTLSAKEMKGAPTALEGALLQWLNPKAWLASIAGIGAYAADGDRMHLFVFAVIYFLICYLSIGLWALAGAVMHGWVDSPARLRLLNRSLSALLIASALYLGLSGILA